jgi:hypothetical protein
MLAVGTVHTACAEPPQPVAPAAPVPGSLAESEHNMPDPETPAPGVLTAAKAAVAKLGSEVVLGRYSVAIDQMYPAWKKRLAQRMGGMEKLNAQLADTAKKMQNNGVSIISFKPQGETSVHEVMLGRKTVTVNGKQVQVVTFTKWLLIIPTATQFKFFKVDQPGAAPTLHVVESTGFQVVISDKGANDWTFIDGSGLSVSDLRSLFSNLPEDLVLPAMGGHEIKGDEQR